MPPRKSSKAGSAEAPVEMLVARLSRAELEELPVSYGPLLPANRLRTDLLARLSISLHGREVAARAPVGGDEALVETGCFAKLDAEVRAAFD